MPSSFGAALEPVAHHASFLCACAHNLLAHLGAHLALLLAAIFTALGHPERRREDLAAA